MRQVYDKICKSGSVAKQYLPDNNPNADKFIDRDFLFNVVNTCEPAFFPSALADIEEE